MTTLEKAASREHLRQRVVAELDPLSDAQLEHAKGIKHLMLDLFRRFVEHPIQQEIRLTGDMSVVSRLQAARQRAAKASGGLKS